MATYILKTATRDIRLKHTDKSAIGKALVVADEIFRGDVLRPADAATRDALVNLLNGMDFSTSTWNVWVTSAPGTPHYAINATLTGRYDDAVELAAREVKAVAVRLQVSENDIVVDITEVL